jgi:hypothetical protein
MKRNEMMNRMTVQQLNMPLLTIMMFSLLFFTPLLPRREAVAQGFNASISVLEPKEGAVYSPGGKVYISLQAGDPRELIKRVAFFVISPESRNPAAPFFVDDNPADGWGAVWVVPPGAREGWYRISCQGFDKNGVRCCREVRVPVMVKSSPVKLTLGFPTNGLKCPAGEVLQITGQLVDNNGAVKRVDFFLYPLSSGQPPSPDVVLKKLYSGCSAKIKVPADAQGNYEALARAFSAEEGGECLAEARVRIVVGQADTGLKLQEPKNGTVFYPGQKVFVFAQVEDKGGKVTGARFYYGQKDKGAEPHALEIRRSGEVKGDFNVPYEDSGPMPIRVEVLNRDSLVVASASISITVNKPIVGMAVKVPANGAYYYPGEEVFINVEFDDRASVIDKMGFVTFPKGQPLASTMVHSQKTNGRNVSMAFELPATVKPGWYILQVTARDARGTSVIQKNINFEIRK